MSRVIFVRTAAKAGAGQLVKRPVDLPALPDRVGSIGALWAQEVGLGGVEGMRQGEGTGKRSNTPSLL